MIINFLALFTLNIIFLLYGNLITKCYPSCFDRSDKHYLSSRLILGSLFIGSSSLIYNFFDGIFTVNFYIFLFIILIISIFLFYREGGLKKFQIKYLYILLLCSIFFIFYSTQLIPGYDAGLYHIPHQVLIRDEKISLGLTSIHVRYGLATFYNYIAALLWYKNDFTFVSLLQSMYLVIFFIFLYELTSHKIKILTILVMSTLLAMPVWFRYNIPGFALVDLSYGIFFFIAIVLSTLILIDQKEFNKEKYFIIFLSVSVLCFMHKSNGAQLFPLVTLVILFKFFKKNLKLYNLIKILAIPTIILTLWLIRTVLISGCIVFPVENSCFNFWWMPEQEAANTLSVISSWAKRGFGVYQFNPMVIFAVLISSIFLIFLILKKGLSFLILIEKNKVFKNTTIVIIGILLILIYWNASDLRGFSAIVTSGDVVVFKSVIVKEIILLISVNSLVLLFVLILSNFNTNLDFQIRNNLLSKIPSLFVFVYLIFWLYLAPNPRFAIGAFALIIPSFIIIFFYNFKSYSDKILDKSSKYLFLLIIFKITFFNAYITESLSFDIKKIPTPEVFKREHYGVQPVDIIKDNRCWMIKKCYSDLHIVKFKKTHFDYKIFYRSLK